MRSLFKFGRHSLESTRYRPRFLSSASGSGGSELRGSAFLPDLPSSLSPSTIEVVKATAPVVAEHSLTITNRFYSLLFGAHPELLHGFFNKTNQVTSAQPKRLAAAIVAYASNIEDLTPLVGPYSPVDAMAHRHCALNIIPEQYPIVHEHLMQSVADILGEAVTPEIASAWSESVLFLSKVLIDREEELYKEAEARPGGWRGYKEFKVTDIETICPNTKQVTFSPLDGSSDPISFTPGQYVTVKLQSDLSPRHYTITSPSDSASLQCMVKLVPGGASSTYIHSKLGVGDTISLTPPFGNFSPRPSSSSKDMILISAGIGVTPFLNFARSSSADRIQHIVHVDKTSCSAPFVSSFSEAGVTCDSLTSDSGSDRPDMKQVVDDVIAVNGKGHDFFVCGPEGFRNDVKKALMEQGQKVVIESFGAR